MAYLETDNEKDKQSFGGGRGGGGGMPHQRSRNMTGNK